MLTLATIIINKMILIYLFLLGLVNSCGLNCSNCNSLSCLACTQGTQLNIDGQCTSSSLLPNCAVSFSNSICNQCKPTFALTFASVCQKDYSGCIESDLFTGLCSVCIFGMKLIGGYCEGVLNCGEYQGRQCLKCQGKFQFKNGICEYIGPGCLDVDPFTGSCLSCGQGYDSVGYECISISGRVANCYLYNSLGQCSFCKVGYVKTSAFKCVLPPNALCSQYEPSGQCIQCNGTLLQFQNGICLDPNCLKGTIGNCQSCKPGYSSTLNNVCQLNDTNCQQYSQNRLECLTCIQGYFVSVDRICLKLPANCRAADIFKHTCIGCNQGYNLQGGKCVRSALILNCLLMNPSRTGCVVCQNRYYLVEGNCKAVSNLCDGYDPTSGMCFGCKGGYTNFGGQCRDPNCQVQQSDICIKCKTNFQVQPHGLCYFSDVNCLRATIRSCNQCKQGYYLNIGVCSLLPVNCLSVASTGTCAQCKQTYQLSNGLCVTPLIGCVRYEMTTSKLSACVNCQVGFNLVAGSCQILQQSDPNCISVKNGICVLCSNRYYFQFDRCVPVNPHCKSYNMTNGNCTDCYPGFMLHNGGCPPAPAKDPNCRVITPSGCIECYQSFYVLNGTCDQINTLCKTSNNQTGECLSCYQGYSLNKGLCSSSFSDPNCRQYGDNGDCLKCSDKYFKMQGLCTRVSALCKTYSITTGRCISCYPGYYLAGGACWAGNDPNLDPNCNLRSISGSCLQCVPSYYQASNGYCKSANPLCRTFNLTTGACLTCYKGYFVKGVNCALSSSGSIDPNCLRFLSSGLCEQCYTSFYPIAGVCQQINPLCRVANQNDGTCQSCYPGYTLQAGNCIIPVSFSQGASDPYCLSFLGGKCSKCRQGYFPVGGTCSQVDPQCQIFDYQNARCGQCYQGYQATEFGCSLQAQAVIAFCQTLASDGNCQTCMQGYYSSAPKVCTAVSTLCFTYDEGTGACKSCISGYFFQSGSCIYPAMGYDPNCQFYETSSFCGKCSPGYSLVNYICNLVDTNCVNFDTGTSTCLECQNGMMPSGKGCV